MVMRKRPLYLRIVPDRRSIRIAQTEPEIARDGISVHGSNVETCPCD